MHLAFGILPTLNLWSLHCIALVAQEAALSGLVFDLVSSKSQFARYVCDGLVSDNE